MPRLQIGIEINSDGDSDYEIRVAPLDVPVPPDVAKAAQILASHFDMADFQPGDGDADFPIKATIPIKFWFIKTGVKIEGSMFIRVKN